METTRFQVVLNSHKKVVFTQPIYSSLTVGIDGCRGRELDTPISDWVIHQKSGFTVLGEYDAARLYFYPTEWGIYGKTALPIPGTVTSVVQLILREYGGKICKVAKIDSLEKVLVMDTTRVTS